MIFLNHIKTQTYHKKRMYARIFAIGFGAILLIIWTAYTLGFSTQITSLPDINTPTSILKSGFNDVVDTVGSGISNLQK